MAKRVGRENQKMVVIKLDSNTRDLLQRISDSPEINQTHFSQAVLKALSIYDNEFKELQRQNKEYELKINRITHLYAKKIELLQNKNHIDDQIKSLDLELKNSFINNKIEESYTKIKTMVV